MAPKIKKPFKCSSHKWNVNFNYVSHSVCKISSTNKNNTEKIERKFNTSTEVIPSISASLVLILLN